MTDPMSTTRRIAAGVLAAGAVGTAVLTGQLAAAHATAPSASTTATTGSASPGEDSQSQQDGGGFAPVPGVRGGTGRGATSTRGS